VLGLQVLRRAREASWLRMVMRYLVASKGTRRVFGATVETSKLLLVENN